MIGIPIPIIIIHPRVLLAGNGAASRGYDAAPTLDISSIVKLICPLLARALSPRDPASRAPSKACFPWWS